jgi:hypothetical protein
VQMARHRRLGIALLGVVALVVASSGSAVAGQTKAAAPSAVQIGEGKWCYAFMLTDEQVAAGATSTLYCFATRAALEAAEPGGGAGAGGFVTMAFGYQAIGRHYDSPLGVGAYFQVYGTACTGGGLSLVGTAWDNVISSTAHGACGKITHYATGSYGSPSYQTSGPCGGLRGMTGALNNTVSSIKYFTPEDPNCFL